MKQHNARLCSAAGLVIVLNAATTSTIAGQQPPSPNPPVQGQRLEARDGDTVILEGDARVNIVRRRQAHVRAVFNQAQASLLLLVSHVVADAGTAGQGVDETFTFQALSGAWPLGARWEGDAVLEQYSDSVSRGLPSGIGFSSPLGMVQLFGRAEDQQLFADPGAAAVLFYRGSGAGGGGRQTFDDAERMQIAMATRDAETNARLPAGAQSMTMSLGSSGGPVGGVATITGPAEAASLRVGGPVASPRKIFDVPPILPEQARQAGIRGVVILEITIGTDGTVIDARVLRSIPLLDSAALECARQWRYEPVLLNGRPVPIVMTTPVSFP